MKWRTGGDNPAAMVVGAEYEVLQRATVRQTEDIGSARVRGLAVGSTVVAAAFVQLPATGQIRVQVGGSNGCAADR
eukprot:COSAG01_NODE_2323_length_7908_cov_43.508388_12_plen_76_part_00